MPITAKAMKDVSLDIETLDTVPGAKILTIGAVRFCRQTGALDEPFYVALDPTLTPGSVSRSTFRWWKGQSEEAREAAFGGRTEPAKAMHMLAEYVGNDTCVWGNGAHFDISLLEWLFNATGVGIPWKFWNVRDMRTVVDLSPLDKNAIPFEGVAHNAQADAVHQAKVIGAMIQSLRFPDAWANAGLGNS